MDVLLVRQYDLLRCLDANLPANRSDRQPQGNGDAASRRQSSDALTTDDSRKSILSKSSTPPCGPSFSSKVFRVHANVLLCPLLARRCIVRDAPLPADC